MDPAQFHVVPRGDRWDIERNGASLISYPTRALAIEAAHDQARAAEPSQVLVHSREGQIEQEATYGDPFPPSGSP